MQNKTKTAKADFKEEDVLQAIVVADSFDTRFHPLTLEKSKILLPFLNIPFIEFVLDSLKRAEIQETFIFCCQHAAQIKKYLANSRWLKPSCKMKVHVILSENCSSLGDALRDMDNKGLIRSDFVLLHGDVISNVELKPIIERHRERRREIKATAMTMLFKEASTDSSLKTEDDIMLLVQNDQNRIVSFKNLAKNTDCFIPMEHVDNKVSLRCDLINCNLLVCSPVVLTLMTDNFDYQSIEDLTKGILDNEEVLGNLIFFHTIKSHEYAARAKSFRSYEAITADVLKRWTYPLVLDSNITNSSDDNYAYYSEKNIYLHSALNGSDLSNLEKNVVVGSGTTIGKNTKIMNSVIGKNCQIGCNVQLQNCYVFDGVVIENGCRLSTCFVSDFAHIRENATVPNGCIIGSNVCVNSTDELMCNTRLVSSSMDDVLNSLPGRDDCYVYFSKIIEDGTCDGENWDWGEVVEESESEDFSEDDGNEEEDEADGDFEEESDSRNFYNEVVQNLKRSIDEDIPSETVILEINSAKSVFSIQIGELNALLIRALLEMPLKSTPQPKDPASYFTGFTTLIKRFILLLRKYVKTQEAEKDVLSSMAEFSDSNPLVLRAFMSIAKFLYEEDVLSENGILKWWNDGLETHSPVLKEKLAPFINWLETADEDSSDDDDD